MDDFTELCGIPGVLAWTAITKYPKLGGLNTRNLFLRVLEAGKAKIKVPADLVPLFLAYLLSVSSHGRGGVLVSLPLLFLNIYLFGIVSLS